MDFDFSVVTDHWRFLASGVGITLLLSVVSGLTSLVAGLVVALLRLYGPRPLRLAVVLYIDSMRAIPVLVVLVWSFFALPLLTGLTMPPFLAALVPSAAQHERGRGAGGGFPWNAALSKDLPGHGRARAVAGQGSNDEIRLI